MKQNPFKVIKATHLEDNNIVKYWVDIFNKETNQDSFKKLLSPETAAPMIILGSKGSGKTHVLRFYSYLAQKIRASYNNTTPLEQLKKEGFMSVYLELGNFAFQRFSSSSIPQKVLNEWYYYYLNIILTESFLEQIIDLMNSSQFNDFDMIKIDKLVENHFFDSEDIQIHSIEDLLRIIKKSHKSIDKKLSTINTTLDTSFDGLELLFDSGGNKFFDIVHYVMQSSKLLQNIRVVFLIDQLEDLSINQQIYTNTIIRHPKYNETISLRFAGRLHAIKTVNTLSDKEKILNAEVDIKYLENFMVDDNDSKKTHEDFSVRLCKNRLKNIINKKLSADHIKSSFSDYNLEKSLSKIISKHPLSKDRYYFKDLEIQLKKYDSQLGINSSSVNQIISNLSYPSNPLKEKTNIYLLYQQGWSKNKNLLDISTDIKQSLKVHLEGGKSLHSVSTIRHIQDNLQYQLLKRYHLPIYHCGFSSILNYTLLNPRSFINILKFMHEHCEFADEKLFFGDRVSCKVQNRAIREASEWFWSDAINDIENKDVIRMIKRLNEFLKKIRLTDKPYEKTLISFAYDDDNIDNAAREIIKSAQEHSLLIEDRDGKKAKNKSELLYKKFQINPMLTIKWDLPSQVGDTHEFSSYDINVLCLGSNDKWDEVVSKYIKPLNIPFNMSMQATLDFERDS